VVENFRINVLAAERKKTVLALLDTLVTSVAELFSAVFDSSSFTPVPLDSFDPENHKYKKIIIIKKSHKYKKNHKYKKIINMKKKS